MKLIYLLFLLPLFYTPPASVIKWEVDTTQDLGLLKLDTPSTVEFTFTNITEEPFTIDNIRVTCGCTTPEWDLTPVMPGEKGSIFVTYDAKKAGYFYKKVRVFFSTQRKAEVLFIEGEVE